MSTPAVHPAPVCEEREEQLSQLLDGDLTAAERSELEGHLETCGGCRRALVELREMTASLEQMGSLVPPPELFPAVEAAVGKRRRRRLWGATALAAGLGAAGVITALVLTREPARPIRVTVPTHITLWDRATAEFQKAERHYRTAIGMLRRITEQEKPQWPTDRRRAYDADVQMLDRTLEEARRLARRAPADPAVQEMLFASYRAHIDYLRDVLVPHQDDSI